MARSPPKSPQSRAFDAFTASNVTAVYSKEGTQLAEAAPQLDFPQRIDAPESIKTPARCFPQTREERIQKTVFSPHAAALRTLKQQIRMSFDNGADLEAKLSCCSLSKLKNSGRKVSSRLIKEYSMLAESSKRAGRHDAECIAYLCLGILYDNIEDYSKAIDFYLLVLSISESTKNKLFMGLATNCTGVNYQLLSLVNDYSYTGKYVNAESRLLQNARVYHQKHLEVADDAGKFVAHLNLGLTLGSLGEPNEAARHYQEALRLAIQLNSAYGQSIAVGNLGLLASRQEDLETAAACMNQHLQLTQSVSDRPAEIFAWIHLGHLAGRQSDFIRAERAFDQAYRLAQEIGDVGTAKQCSCYLGIARARLHMQDYVHQLRSSLLIK
ncbi:Predicted G-alpha GTPase interaction protein, contains GoLoco domain [Plasmopara halstedii]|uniref:Predicted G-alpha GTPase interaction protein, contains GoLoco domain n=1 Tax=Plasmopara halstedii TaxID=4781 RepID=A0A0P1AFJ4_PLAHL|nr:Predicted G-alpha GTPase interaction protein, contains GoLoco domain [Plasmopara halstedii]CEG39194.1 Predicted G-alpha GTPase interaction protein, contains GoLoco domain [Plasmopara halstedii]|eukprot:XP_024575563.1 Predicted G-alpha GTPase interaction protein, contains GoLoco domain [Plasmopara halstedii]